MKKFLFNRNPVVVGNSIDEPAVEALKNTPGLWNASLDDALKYGGEITRAAIGAMNLRFDRKHIVVDTKVHMLMPGFYPCIPGWHTDGVPRGPELNPAGKGAPNIFAQDSMASTRYHLLVTGSGCLTKFLTSPLTLNIPDEPTTDLYKLADGQVRDMFEGRDMCGFTAESAPSCTVVEFDWWTLHTGVKATKHEWRYLIRVTETDHFTPQTDLRQVIRTQQQVYVPESFGW
jgi:hypothetical protein